MGDIHQHSRVLELLKYKSWTTKPVTLFMGPRETVEACYLARGQPTDKEASTQPGLLAYTFRLRHSGKVASRLFS